MALGWFDGWLGCMVLLSEQLVNSPNKPGLSSGWLVIEIVKGHPHPPTLV